ncbi:MAG TPA: LysR family transcriptional regulator [Kofleriaceae bacterium]|jgi:LysR family transcriptional activator of nhaA|nr:LysR family transcriptional regulator [Kofleriaceae bacterium]
MLNYNHLYYFHVAASENSLSAAAAKLGVKQSTVSEQLRALERALRQRLFERTAGGMRLTGAGEVAYEYTTIMFRAGERLLQALGHDDVPAPRSLRVGISGAVARATSTDFLLPLFALDDCMPTISTSETLDLVRDLRANELDLVLCETEPTAATIQGLRRAVIEHIPLLAIAAADLDPGPDWQDTGLVQYRSSSTFHFEVKAFLEQRGLKPRIVGEADDPFLLVEAAARGRYVVIVPRSVVRDALAAGRVRILAQIESAHAGVHALYQDGTAAELAQRAIEKLIATARANVGTN